MVSVFPMILFTVALLIIVLSNISTTRNLMPIKDSWIQLANLVAAGMLFVWGVRAGALGGGV